MPRIFDIFSGCGGFTLGFQMAGFEVAGCVEIKPAHAEVYRQNFSTAKIFNKSVLEVSGKEILDATGKIDLLLLASPCQGFSRQGLQDEKDPRSSLIWESVRLVRDCRPDYFLMENVEELVRNKKFDSIVKGVLNGMRSLGYSVGYRVLNTCDFGIPQSRSRVFFMGRKNGKPLPKFPDPGKAFYEARITIKDAIADLPEIEEFEELIEQDSLDYSFLKSPSEYVWRLNRDNIPSRITGMQRTQHNNEIRNRFASTLPGKVEPISRFKKLEWGGISPTLRAGYSQSRHSASRPIHPGTPRCISVREYARIQGFPDSFILSPVKTLAYQQVGNSVSPILAEAFAREFLAVM